MRPKLSLCMIVRNEEHYLPNSLRSVEGIVDEMVVVDTGSTDATVRVAEGFGARVLKHVWQNDFAAARNASLDAALGEWILVLDADEELPRESHAILGELPRVPRMDAFEVHVRSLLPDGDPAVFEESKIIRLFRNRKDFRYTMPIHEQVRPSIEEHNGRIGPSDLVIVHHGYVRREVQGGEDRAERNLRLLHSMLSTSNNNPYARYQLGATLMSMGRREEAYEQLRKVLGLDYTGLGSAVLDKLYMKISQLALERDKYGEAIEFAEKSLEHNPHNQISQYVAAVGYLSNREVKRGYGYLLKIRQNRNSNLRIGDQLEKLIAACEKALNI